MTDVEEELKKYPAEPSPPEVLELKPNNLKREGAISGPDEQISSIGYTTWTKPDGSTFVAPVANDETYARKGFKKGATEDIPDLVAYQAENAKKEPPKQQAEPAKAPVKASS